MEPKRHPRVLSTSNSILWIVLGSKMQRGPTTYTIQHKEDDFYDPLSMYIFNSNTKRKIIIYNLVYTPMPNRYFERSQVFRKSFIFRLITWRSSRRGTSVSSILAARERQATDRSCIIQALPFYTHIWLYRDVWLCHRFRMKNGNQKLKAESGTLPEVDGEKGIDQDSWQIRQQ